jgi:hypothetical protein
MAVGFPAKTTYANGDVFSASDINDTNGTLNLTGWTLINTTSFSAVSSQSITSIFNSTYDDYFVTIDFDTSTTAELRLRLRTTSDDTGSGTYQDHAYLMGSDGGSLNYANNGTAGYQRLTVYTGTYRAHVEFVMAGPNISGVQTNETGRFAYRGVAGVLFDGYMGMNTTTTTAYTGFTIYPDAGTITGKVRVYGMRTA